MNINPEIYNKNMMSLYLKYPEIAERVKLTTIVNYTLSQSKKCVPNITHKMLKEPWYQGRIDEYCENHWKSINFKKIKSCIFLGFGLGYELSYFLQVKAKESNLQSVIIIERDIEVFTIAMNAIDMTHFINNENLTFFVGLSQNQLYTTFLDFYKSNMKQCLLQGSTKFLYTSYPFKIDKTYYTSCINELFQAGFTCLQSFGNDPDDSLVGLENMLENINEIVENPGINLLYDKFKNKPAVIVATGPSLNKNMELLKGLEDKALILSVDASFKYLMKNDIKPHMVTSLEREHAVQQFFDNHNKEDVKDVFMTACPVLFNHVYESYNGPKIIVYRQFDHFKWLGIDKGMMDIKLSSSNMAFKIAHKLGCDPIILIGQDLAYGEGDQTHACDVPFSSEGENIFEVPGNLGGNVKTNSGWYNFLKAYEADIVDYRKTGGKVINCTEGGAFINGTYEVATFQHTIEKYIKESFNPLEIIKDSIKDFKATSEDKLHLHNLVNKTEEDINIIIDLCDDSINNHEDYIKDIDKKKDEEIREIFNIITKNRITITTTYFNTYQLFLMHVIQSAHISFELKLAMNCENLKEIAINYLEWYINVKKITEICKKSLLKAKNKLLS